MRVRRIKLFTHGGQADIYTGIPDKSKIVCICSLFLCIQFSGFICLLLSGYPQDLPAYDQRERDELKKDGMYRFHQSEPACTDSKSLTAIKSSSSNMVTPTPSLYVAVPGHLSWWSFGNPVPRLTLPCKWQYHVVYGRQPIYWLVHQAHVGMYEK